MSGSSGMPRLSVVIPSYQRCEILAQTLATIVAQVVPDERFEVVVVIDGSTDGTERMLAERFAGQGLRVITQANAGPAAARNAGILAARGELVLLLDDDLRCDPGLLAAHLAAHADGVPKAVFGPVFGLTGDSTAAELTRRALDSYYRQMRDEWHPDTAPIAYAAPNTSLRRETLIAVGGFDLRFARALEDADLGLRLRASGLPFVYLPDATVHQRFTKSAQDLVDRDAVDHGRNEVLLCRIHPTARAHSFLRSVGSGGPLRRALRSVLVWSPVAPELLLRPLFAVLDWLPPHLLLDSRIWLLGLRGYAAQLRAATATAGGWRALKAEFGMRCPALLYHHIGPAPAGMPASLTTAPDRFERQMTRLQRLGFTAITADRWLAWLEHATPLPERPFVLTFDDGFADLAQHAFPVLERLGFGATVFVVTDCIGGTNDWDASPGTTPVRLLDRVAMEHWRDRGITFASHSRTHGLMDVLEAPAASEEAIASRRALEAVTGRSVRVFAYPYGAFTPRTVAAVERTYSLAFTCIDGVNTLATPSALQHRTMVQPADWQIDVELRARHGWSATNRMRAILSSFRARLRR